MLGTIKRTAAMLPAVALLSSIATTAGAAPQILAVVASLVDVPLNCDGGNCVAELTTICLTEHRAAPGPGTPYQIHQPDSLTLTGTRPDGTKVTLELPDAVSFNAARGHLSAQINIPARILKELGMTELAVRATRNTTLIPIARDADPRPLGDVEVTLAAGPLRAAAATVIESSATTVAAAQVMSMLVSALPAGGRVADATRAAAWDNAVARTAGTLNAEGVTLAQARHDS